MNARGERTKSLWMKVDVAPGRAPLKGQIRCDTVVVGSGIAGLSVAYELAELGRSVIVVDRGAIAGGMTSRTTAHLAPVCDDGLSSLIKMRGEETARLFQKSQEAAVDRIEEIVARHDIACNFRRLDAFLFPALEMEKSEARDQVDEEYDAARKLGAEAEKTKGVPLKGFEDAPVLRYARQGTFHPLKYLKGLVAVIEANGGRLFADSPIMEFEETETGVRITSDNGATIEAPSAVVATNSPVNDRATLHSKMAPYRTYAMAFTIPRGTLPDALYWDMADPYHYVRLNPGPGSTDYLIVGGADHKSGEADDGDVRFEAVEAWIRQLVPDLGKEVHRWSGQVMDTIDYCGFIGRNPDSKNIYVATGDSGQGMTHGVVAGLLLRDLIEGRENRWTQVYEPSRKTPTGIVNYVSENLTALKSLAEHVTPGELNSLDELESGQGGIIREGLKKIAAFKDEDGKLFLRSAVCTHLGCHIHWNSTERCWDCPCHGSHFAPDGSVLNGPAISPLPELDATGREPGRKKEKASG
jgi:glycine/D-amino acid oxidase-like deaminating enzyme/nitrite reductase/ring-hydroxylating ferredoxin subunit